MVANNQGITHAAFRDGGEPLCKNRNAHTSTGLDKFRTDPQPCKRCAAKLSKIDAVTAKREARLLVRPGR
jgi:hypothetical protein